MSDLCSNMLRVAFEVSSEIIPSLQIVTQGPKYYRSTTKR